VFASQSLEIVRQYMSPWDREAEIAAFIRAKGITRCPTACAAPTQASGSAADRAALRQRAEQREAARQERLRQIRLRMVTAA
jgi:hypothetical protein